MSYDTNEPILDRIFHEGYDLLKAKGMRKMSILDITRAVDIATGTFYHYFPTKEDFVYQMIRYYRDEISREFDKRLVDGHMDKEGFRVFLLDLIDTFRDVYSLLTPIEQQRLIERYPLNNTDSDSKMMTFSAKLLSHLTDVREDCDWRVFSNMLSGLSKLYSNRSAMYLDYFTTTMEQFVDALLRYTFK